MAHDRPGPTELREILRLARLGMPVPDLCKQFDVSPGFVVRVTEAVVAGPLVWERTEPLSSSARPAPNVLLAERFDKKVEQTPDCWLWRGAKNASGYGLFLDGGNTWLAHRWIYEARIEPIPRGHVVRHLCHVRLCVRTSHLASGTQAQNASDSVAKRRGISLIGD